MQGVYFSQRNTNNMIKVKEKTQTVIKTWDGDIYIIKDKTPQEVMEYIHDLDSIEMPDGSFVMKGSISKVQPMKAYEWQAEAKYRHKRGQYIHSGKWYDHQGEVAPARLEQVTGDILLDKPDKN